MCGIAGFVQYNQKIGNIDTLLEMGDVIAHRGPDAHGEFLDDQVGLCHRRLSIIDLSEAGNQPIFSEDNNLVLVFNGEIYNFLELRKEAEAKGYRFKTHTDSEVILALYQLEGERCVNKLNGMFAFAIWDKRERTLFMARDRLGKKPLYFFNDGRNFVFGSEIKSLLKVPCVTKEVRHDAVYDFFAYQYIPDPKTIFKNIFKVKPGHFLTVSEKEIKEREYWDVSFAKQSTKSEPEIRDELLHLLDESTKQRMISDVPLGAFLSGGIDSSGIVALMANASDKPVTTCSIGFDSKKYDETKFAQLVADQYKTDHHEFTVTKNVEDNLRHIASFFDEPFADASFIPTYFVSQLARKKVTVALAGDGGDECFAGYQKYGVDAFENRLRNSVPSVLRKTLMPLLARILSKSRNTLFKKGYTLMNTLSMDPDYGFYLSNSFCNDLTWNQLVSPELSRELGGYHPSEITREFYNKSDAQDHLSKILYTDIKTYMTGDILVKVDRMSMANSLEVRAPILDYRVVEYAATIPSRLKFNKGEKKHILKEAFKPLLSDDTLYRKKMGFSAPVANWLRFDIKEMAQTALFAKESGISQFLNMNSLKSLWQQHQNGDRDYSNELWSALMFELWWQHYME